jgi:hypothetical protein
MMEGTSTSVNNMEPEEAYLRYKLGLLTSDDIAGLARSWIESDSHFSDELVEIYTERNPTMAEVGPLFESAVRELGVPEATRQQAARSLISSTLNHIASGETDPVEGATLLYHLHIDLSSELPDRKYVGDSLGLEHVFCWLREYWDCRDGDTILYHTDLPRKEAEKLFVQHIVEEARRLRGHEPADEHQ